jgi:tRNA-dihydrouridine synthase 3
MAMAQNLLIGHQAEWSLLRRHSCEDIFGVQIAGGYPETMAQCCELVSDYCDVDFIDLNLGCPIDVVCNKGAGSALLQRQARLRRIVQCSSEVLKDRCPLTIKMRKGFAEKKPVALELMPKLKVPLCPLLCSPSSPRPFVPPSHPPA